MSDDRDRLKELLKSVLGVDTVTDHASQEEHAEWDSMAYMSVVARVEDEFGVEATAENIEEFASLDGILKVIETTRNGGE